MYALLVAVVTTDVNDDNTQVGDYICKSVSRSLSKLYSFSSFPTQIKTDIYKEQAINFGQAN